MDDVAIHCSEDVRCVWLATLWSRTLLQKTRRASSKNCHTGGDLCLTDELRPAYEEACRLGNELTERTLPSNDNFILGALALKPLERYKHASAGNLGAALRQQISHWTVLAGRPLDKFALLFSVEETMELSRPMVWSTIAGRRGGAFVTVLEDGQQGRMRVQIKSIRCLLLPSRRSCDCRCPML